MGAIPRLTESTAIDSSTRAYLDAAIASGFGGEISTDYGTRLMAATDNSVYQVLPAAVVFPRNAEDVATLCRLAGTAEFRGITYAPRGGGTGTNGQSLTGGIVIDVSRHMADIVEVNIEQGWVDVQPGVVLDQLNARLAPHGMFFAPNLSPSSRATLGGMINTDAAGKGSRIYGRTSDHIVSLDVVLTDGTAWTSRALSAEELGEVEARPDAVGRVCRDVRELLDARRGPIAEKYRDLARFMTGYNLARIQPEAGGSFNLNYLLSGSEGTLGIMTGARLRIVPIPTHRKLVLLRYASFDEALASASAVVESDPGAIETVDSTILELARRDVIYHRVARFLDVGDDVPTAGVNLVEFWGESERDVDAQVDGLTSWAAEHRGETGCPIGYSVAQTAEERDALWDLRKKGVGLLAALNTTRQPIAFVEDTCVPPARLADYIRDFRELLDRHGLRYGMFGHVDVGCLHVRPALDIKDPEDEARLRTISDEVAALVDSYGGVMWGEHGKGFRSEYNQRFFGDDVYRDFCRVKGAFDPYNQLNPGKLAVPLASDAELVRVDGPTRGAQERQIAESYRARYAVTLRCNGNGACFDYHPDHVMCPSSKVTRDRMHSPKGRAAMVREWLRQLSRAGVGSVDPWAPVSLWSGFSSWVRGVMGRAPETDYSHEVKGAMNGCLACKACTTMCPVNVDVPTFRSEFLAVYHRRYARPLKDRLAASLEFVLPWLARWPSLGNALANNPVSTSILRWIGIVDSPRLSKRPVRAALREANLPLAEPSVLRGLSAEAKARAVILTQDAFTSFYEVDVLVATGRLLRRLGFEPYIAPFRANGKGQHIKGYLAGFRRTAQRTARLFRALADTGVPLVGVEPAVTLTYRDEYAHALDSSALGEPHKLGFEVHLLQEWLVSRLEDLPQGGAKRISDAYRLFAHCTERSLVLDTPKAWSAVFERLGVPIEVEQVGCCGMCGVYGHERQHLEESKGIFEMSWARKLPQEATEKRRVLATGHSCRSQCKRFAGFVPLHPAQALLQALGENPGEEATT